MIGVDLRSLFCDKKESFSEMEMLTNNLLSESEQKHATYHGPTKYISRPSLEWSHYSHSYNDDSTKKYNEISSDTNILFNKLSNLSVSKEKLKSPYTSNESDLTIPFQKCKISLNDNRIYRRTSSNTSIDSSNVNPSFYLNENYGPVSSLSSLSSNLNSSLPRPTYLNLDQSNNCDNLQKCGSLYSPSNPSTPLNHHYDSKNTPLSGSSPQRTVRFNIIDISDSILSSIPNHQTLLDLPVEGQSQDGTIPLTALLSKQEKLNLK